MHLILKIKKIKILTETQKLEENYVKSITCLLITCLFKNTFFAFYALSKGIYFPNPLVDEK